MSWIPVSHVDGQGKQVRDLLENVAIADDNDWQPSIPVGVKVELDDKLGADGRRTAHGNADWRVFICLVTHG